MSPPYQTVTPLQALILKGFSLSKPLHKGVRCNGLEADFSFKINGCNGVTVW
jgi:hypothetical protein